MTLIMRCAVGHARPWSVTLHPGIRSARAATHEHGSQGRVLAPRGARSMQEDQRRRGVHAPAARARVEQRGRRTRVVRVRRGRVHEHDRLRALCQHGGHAPAVSTQPQQHAPAGPRGELCATIARTALSAPIAQAPSCCCGCRTHTHTCAHERAHSSRRRQREFAPLRRPRRGSAGLTMYARIVVLKGGQDACQARRNAAESTHTPPQTPAPRRPRCTLHALPSQRASGIFTRAWLAIER